VGKKQKRAKHSRKRRLLVLLLAVAIVSVLSTAVYAVSYSESSDAFNRLSVYCSTYTKIPHVFSGDSHQTPFTHYLVTFGVNNTSSTDVDASWKVVATNQSWSDYTTVGDTRSFTVLHRSTTLASFAIYVNQVNMTVHPWELEVSESFKISLFDFQRSFVPSSSLSPCP